MTHDWRPQASLETLRQRAQVLAIIREFFAKRGVLEVETPALMPTTATDIYIDSFHVDTRVDPQREIGQYLFLQTSPEFPLKRLLAAGSGAIYQLAKVFRREQASKRHSAEFTMLEWYRPGYTLDTLMDEVEALVVEVFDATTGDAARVTEIAIARVTYRDLFLEHLNIDPHVASDQDFESLAHEKIALSAEGLSRTDYLQLLLAHCIEPSLPFACFIYDYPVQQAALARIEVDRTGQAVARRFELFIAGMELANGYFELQDAREQRARFEADIAERERRGFDAVPLDEKLLAALEHGLPECSGVALGVDRLIMAALGKKDIREVQAF